MKKIRTAIYFGESLFDQRIVGTNRYVFKSANWPLGYIEFKSESLQVGYILHSQKVPYSNIESVTKGSAGYIQVNLKSGEGFGFSGPRDKLIIDSLKKHGLSVPNSKKLVRNSQIGLYIMISLAIIVLAVGWYLILKNGY